VLDGERKQREFAADKCRPTLLARHHVGRLRRREHDMLTEQLQPGASDDLADQRGRELRVRGERLEETQRVAEHLARGHRQIVEVPAVAALVVDR
jgi:hypothetical protein